jgi:hypothetical protein
MVAPRVPATARVPRVVADMAAGMSMLPPPARATRARGGSRRMAVRARARAMARMSRAWPTASRMWWLVIRGLVAVEPWVSSHQARAVMVREPVRWQWPERAGRVPR